jgi:1-acyl-sn-glycerol-3-phosphate acyltransferase
MAYLMKKRKFNSIQIITYKEIAFLLRFLLKLLYRLEVEGTENIPSEGPAIIETLLNGNILLVFPEGTRWGSKKENGPKRGVAYLAEKTKVPVIPTAIIGANKIWPPQKKIPRLRGKLKVKFGKPIIYEESNNKDKGKEFTLELMKIIKIMIKHEEENI